MPFWLRVAIAVGIAVLIMWFGVAFVRGLARRPETYEGEEPESVEELDVFFVCGECGTEFKVTKLGELSVPRHCGERMGVVRRPGPRTDPSLN